MATRWQVGDKIENRWEIHKILGGVGKSGMGIVYVVYDHEWHEAFAAKTFQDEAFARSPQIAQRFIQEAHVWVNLDIHQNVTQARMVETIAGKPFLFLEYVSGGDLSAWIGTPRLTEDLPQVLRFAIQFCDGMSHALSKGIQAHRDIKPQNCLVTEDHHLKVTDFGLARVFDETPLDEAQGADSVATLGVYLSRTGTAAGTPAYMAPEQFEDAKHVDVRADIYSFGVMLYQMLTGRLPFGGRSNEEFAQLHKGGDPPELGGRLSAFNSVVLTCLAKTPEQRFPDFGAVRKRLAEIYEKLTGETPPQPAFGADLDMRSWHNKGNALYQLGRPHEALACCEKVLTPDYGRLLPPDPDTYRTWILKGILLSDLGRHDEALACYGRALALNPNHVQAWINKGSLLLNLGRPEEALICCNRALEINPHYEFAWDTKGGALAKLRRGVDAIECFDHALTLNPRNRNSWFNKGVTLAALGRWNEALACLEHAQHLQAPQAGQMIQKVRQAMSGTGGPKAEAGGGAADANARSGGLLGRLFGKREVSREQEARDRCEKALASVKLGRIEEALDFNNRAVALNPRFKEAWVAKGMQLATLGRVVESLEALEEARSLGDPFAPQAIEMVLMGLLVPQGIKQPAARPLLQKDLGAEEGEAQVWFEKGCKSLASGQWDAALACYQHVLAVNPEHPGAWANKGTALVRLRRAEEALACFDRALNLNPRYADAWRDKAATLALLGHPAEALTCHDYAIFLNPQLQDGWYNKGLLLGTLGRHTEALDCYDRALAVNPHDAKTWCNKGNALSRLDRREEALNCYDRALGLKPQDPLTWYNRGALLMNDPRRAREAIASFEQAQRLGFPQASQMIQKARQAMAGSAGSKGPAGGR